MHLLLDGLHLESQGHLQEAGQHFTLHTLDYCSVACTCPGSLPAVSYPALLSSISALSCSVMPCPAFPDCALSCQPLPCPALPCCPTQSSPALPWPAVKLLCPAMHCPCCVCQCLSHLPVYTMHQESTVSQELTSTVKVTSTCHQ